MGKRLLPCNLTEAEIASAWAEFDGGLLDRDEMEMVNEVLPQYLFYSPSRKGKERECVCTHCNCGKFTVREDRNPGFFRKKHKEETYCPRCDGVVHLVSLGRMRTFNLVNDVKWQRVTICRTGTDGALLLLSGYVKRYFCWDDLRPDPEISWKAFTYLMPGKRMQWIRTWEPLEQQVSGQWWWDYQWNPGDTVKEPFNPGYRSWWSSNDGDSYFVNTDAIERSSLRYCQIEDWMYKEAGIFLDTGDDPVRNVVKYLSAYTRYPTLEMAVKLGLHTAATDLAVHGIKNHRILNWEGKTIAQFLRLSKQDAKAFLNLGGDLRILKAYRTARKENRVGNMREFIEIVRRVGRDELAEKLVQAAVMAGCTLRVAGNYMESQRDGIDRALTTWIDYMNMAGVLKYDLSRRDVAMPKDLQDRHDAASETVRYQRILIDEEKHRKYNEYLRKMYAFKYGDLCIVVPGSVEDIIREGKVLQHCVGGYAARHFNNKLHILFLRHRRKPNTPFVTIEINARNTMKEKVVIKQIHGYRNEGYLTGLEYGDRKNNARPNVKYKWFLDVWKAWVQAGSRRDKDGRPILPKNREKTA